MLTCSFLQDTALTFVINRFLKSWFTGKQVTWS